MTELDRVGNSDNLINSVSEDFHVSASLREGLAGNAKKKKMECLHGDGAAAAMCPVINNKVLILIKV